MHYKVAKAGINMFSRGLAEKVGPSGVRVNIVSPAVTRSNLTAGKSGYLATVAAAMRAPAGHRAPCCEGLGAPPPGR